MYNKYPIVKSLKINWFFYLTLLICLWLLSIKFNKSFLILIYSIIYISFLGWFIHWGAHKFNITKLYNYK